MQIGQLTSMIMTKQSKTIVERQVQLAQARRSVFEGGAAGGGEFELPSGDEAHFKPISITQYASYGAVCMNNIIAFR